MLHSSRVLSTGAVLAFVLVASAALAGTWSTDFFITGPDRPVHDLVLWDGAVVAAGEFAQVGPYAIAGVAVHAGGISWEPLGDPMPVAMVRDLQVHDGMLHALADVEDGQQVFRLEGQTWQPVGGVVDAMVLASFAGDLYAGSCRWDGAGWVDALQTAGPILDLVVHGDLLVAGGDFDAAAGEPIANVVAWDGANVVDVAPGQDLRVVRLASFGGELYAARWTAGEAVALQVWRDGAWVGLPDFGDATWYSRITALQVTDQALLVVTRIGHIQIKNPATRSGYGETRIRSWDGQASSVLWTDYDRAHGWVTLLPVDDRLWLGGHFRMSAYPATTNLAVLAGGEITPVTAAGRGADNAVTILEHGAPGLAIGGSFTTIGGVQGQEVLHAEDAWVSIARNGSPADFAWREDRLLGAFDLWIDEERHCSYWEDGSWYGDFQIFDIPPLVSVVDWSGRMFVGTTTEIGEAYEDFLYAPFASISGGSLRHLEVVDGVMIAAGSFTAIDGVAVAGIARYDGQVWQPVGDHEPLDVARIGRWRGDLVVADESADDATRMLRWTGQAWEELGSLPFAVRALEDYRGDLYLGGEAEGDLGAPSSDLVRFDGQAWTPIGEIDPAHGGVWALEVVGDALWIGGSFPWAGGVPAQNLTVYRAAATSVEPQEVPVAPGLELTAAPNPFNPATTLRFTLPTASHAVLDVFDVAGRRVARLVDGERTAGAHDVRWTAVDHAGRPLPSGAYLVRLRAGTATATARLALLK